MTTSRRAVAAPSSAIARPRAISGLSSARPHWRGSTADGRRSTTTTATTAAAATAEQQHPPAPTTTTTTTTRRSLLLLAATTAATTTATIATPPPASAGLFSAAPPAPVPASGGWSLSPPPKWTLAYDRSADEATAGTGPKVMWAQFSTLGTIVVSRTTRQEARWPADLRADAPAPADAPGAALSLADALLAEARDSPATYGWRVLASDSHTLPSPSPIRAYDVEFVQQICRGEVLEASGGAKRCANPRDDSDLQVVSRHFLLSACLDPLDADVVWVVRGSCPSEAWAEAGPAIAAAVKSFSFSSQQHPRP